MQKTYRYSDILAASEKIRWRVEDLIGGELTLDFAKPFLPEALARVRPLTFLDDAQRLALNQIRGHGYLYTFILAEEFILPFVLDHTRPALDQDDHKTRAMLTFAEEEAKHIHLFKRFREEFRRGFGSECEVIGPPEAIAKAILAEDPLGVALAILQIEWMTQRHYLDSVQDDSGLDSRFKELLRNHWMEEAQHAKLDTLVVQALAATRTPAEIEAGVAAYLRIGEMLDQGLAQQVGFDLAALERKTGRALSAAQREEFLAVQQQALRWTFLGSGMTHPTFLATLEEIAPAARKRVEQIAQAFC
ncbi:MAG: hypothetical protein IT458_16300 [Planctomycetes bacterium]|nr:hypothetical protein [Planctomycetota bacterium]